MPKTTRLLSVIIPAILLILGGMLLSANAAPDDSLQAKTPAKIARAYSWAVEFQPGWSYSRRSNSDFTISAKKFRSGKSAIRYGLSLSSNFASGANTNRSYNQYDSLYHTYYDDIDSNMQGITLLAQYLRYISIRHPLNFYWGLGPQLEFSHLWDRSKKIGDTPDRRESTRRNYQIGGGLEGVIGAEWFVARRIAITAEYGATATYQYLSAKTELTEDPGQQLAVTGYTRNSFDLRLLNVLFGIAVYF